MPNTKVTREALDRATAKSRREVLALQRRCAVTNISGTSDNVIRVLDLDWSLATGASEDELVRYIREKSALEASVVACRLTPVAAHEQFTLDDPCDLLRVNSKLYASWNRGAWAIVPSHLDCVLFWLTEANGKWQDAVATNKHAGRDLRFDDRMKFNALTYDFIVLEEDEFSRPEDFLATTSNHTVAQHYVSREGRLRCVADDVSFEKLHLPLRGGGGHNDVTPFTIVLSAATRFRCMLDRRAALPAHLHALWAKLQAAVDALFFKPVGWDDPTDRLTDAFVQVSLHGKRRHKPYRDLLAEIEAAEIAKFHRKARRPPRSVVRFDPVQLPDRYRECIAILDDKRSSGTEKNRALFGLLGHD